MAQNTAVEIKDLSKAYGNVEVLHNINIDVRVGECFGLLGPNGAGKSTLLKTVYCNTLIDSGEMYVLGLNGKKNAAEIKSRLGIVPQGNHLDSDFTVKENLLVYASFYGIDSESAFARAEQVLRAVRLSEFQDYSVDQLSGGMKRRLVVARAIMNNPDMLILDEPTTGLDPQSRSWIWDFFHDLKRENKTLLLTTHYIDEAEALCDRVAIMHKGEILTIDSPRNLIREHIGKEVVEFDTNPIDLNYYLGRLKHGKFSYQVVRNTVYVLIAEGKDGRDVLPFISSERVLIRRPSLNDVYLKFTGTDSLHQAPNWDATEEYQGGIDNG
ncbi:MAG TPA: ABC transporter ATP-binding protein [Pseudobdellovibrionaceae bacterium]|jgi:lipooligosaccharide transport system ATP-binding protein|nr:ABC transporter ATP-binding protein [Pseudobdellovibrionaceae bacterium]